MAKNETIKTTDAAEAPARTEAPRLGSIASVRVPDGLLLINSETGQYFPAGEPTPQTVTITTLRRLADGDLVLA